MKILNLFWRQQWVLYLCLFLTFSAAFLFYAAAGERYEAYTLLRAGQGIKERSGSANVALGEGFDLQSRMELLSRIAKIDHVIQEAAKAVGYDRLSFETNPTLLSQVRKALLANVAAWNDWAFGEEVKVVAATDGAQAAIERNQSAILSLRDRVFAKQEGRSDLLRISFRHRDPLVAASYLDELANALVAIHNTDVQMPGAQEFFQQQTKRLEEEAEIAAANLKIFSVKASIYSVDEQRLLLLRRANDLSALISTTRGTIEEKKGQKQAIVDQLQILRPVTQSRTVSRMVRSIGGQDFRKPIDNGAREPDDLGETPPLLLVRVYQDNMAALMKVNADLNGSAELLNQLGAELDQVNKELALLSSKEAEYGRLKRVLTTASTAAAHYATRIQEEEISSEVAKKTQLSSLKVVQRAIPPTSPVFPQVPHLIILALAGGLFLGIGIIVGPELARGSVRSHPNRGSGVGDEDLVDLLVARQRKESSKDRHSA